MRAHHTKEGCCGTPEGSTSAAGFPLFVSFTLGEFSLAGDRGRVSLADFGSFLGDIQIGANSQRYRNEAELRQEFLAKLGELFAASRWTEIKIRLEESLAEGRSDARVSFVVFEFKDPGELDAPKKRESFLNQTIRNLKKTSDKLRVPPYKLKGFLTDGRVAQIVAWHDPTKDYIAVDIGENPKADKLDFRPLTDGAPWLEGAIHILRTRELSPENLLDDFGPGQDLGRKLFSELWRVFQDTKTKSRPKSFFDQWQLMFSSSTRKVVSGEDLKDRIRAYGIEAAEVRSEDDVREFLFVLHTHYAIILKFIALLVADTVELLGPTSLLHRVHTDPSLEWERAEEQLPSLAANLIERDVFSWFHLSEQPELAALIGILAERFTHYDAESVRRDVLKRVYQELIPPKLRKALGEFYTPDWAAELTLDEIGFSGEGRLLDPSCGSGTFLVLAIQRKLASSSGAIPSLSLDSILESVVGFDLNPVAVSTARINYLLSVVDLLRKARPSQGIRIPVYLCDSVVVPSENVLDPAAPTAVVTTCLRDIVVPFAEKSPRQTVEMLRLLGAHGDRSEDSFLEAVRRVLGTTYEENYRQTLRSLHLFISDLQGRDADGIWAQFIENFFAPLFVDRFDFVVGNPPWVAPVHVQKDYRDKVTHLLKRSGYIETYDPKLTESEARYRAAESAYVACLPFVYVALTRYLKDDGRARIGFLLTKSLVTALNAGGWRREALEQLRSVTDLSPITDIHEGANCWAFVPVFGPEKFSGKLPYRFCHRAGPKPKTRGPESVPELATSLWYLNKRALPLDLRDDRSPWLIGPPEVVALFRRMCDNHPRIGDVFSLNRGIDTDYNAAYFVDRIDRVDGSVARVVFSNGETAPIETDLIFPLVTGELISEWSYQSKWIVLPYETKVWKPLTDQVLKRAFPETYSHFSRHRRSLEARAQYRQLKKGTPLWSIFQLSPNKVKCPKVAFPLIELLLKAAPLPLELEVKPLAGERPLIVDHSAYFVNTLSPSAGKYVAALLNSSPYRALAYAIAMPKGGFPYKQYVQWNIAVLPIVPMEKEPALTRRIVTEVESATKQSRLSSPEFLTLLDELVGGLFGFTPKESSTLRRFLEFSVGGTRLWSEGPVEV